MLEQKPSGQANICQLCGAFIKLSFYPEIMDTQIDFFLLPECTPRFRSKYIFESIGKIIIIFSKSVQPAKFVAHTNRKSQSFGKLNLMLFNLFFQVAGPTTGPQTICSWFSLNSGHFDLEYRFYILCSQGKKVVCIFLKQENVINLNVRLKQHQKVWWELFVMPQKCSLITRAFINCANELHML